MIESVRNGATVISSKVKGTKRKISAKAGEEAGVSAPKDEVVRLNKDDYFLNKVPDSDKSKESGIMDKMGKAAIVAVGLGIGLTAVVVGGGIGLLLSAGDKKKEGFSVIASPPFNVESGRKFSSMATNDKEAKFSVKVMGGDFKPKEYTPEEIEKMKEYINNLVLDAPPSSGQSKPKEEPKSQAKEDEGFWMPQNEEMNNASSMMTFEGSMKKNRCGMIDFDLKVKDSDREDNLKLSLEKGGYLAIENPDEKKPAKVQIPISSSGFDNLENLGGQGSLSGLIGFDNISSVEISKKGEEAHIAVSNKDGQYKNFTIEEDSIKISLTNEKIK